MSARGPRGRRENAYAALERVAGRVALGEQRSALLRLAKRILDAMLAGDLDPATDPSRDSRDVQISFALASGALMVAESTRSEHTTARGGSDATARRRT